MRKPRRIESDEERSERAMDEAQARVDSASAELKALDAAVKRSITLHGA